jgi:5'(3')-deoxyribonucleotidase
MYQASEERLSVTKIHPEHLGFDFDGVVADIAEAFIRLSRMDYGCGSIKHEDITHFDVEECLDIDPEIVEAVFTRILLDSVATGLRPMPGAVEVIGELTGHGVVTIVTARPDPQPVQQWLESVMPRTVCRRIKIVAMGAHDDKPRHVLEHGLKYFIDDRAETCHQLDRAGISPIVFAQPWNVGRHSFSIVSNWKEIRELCF